MPCTSSARRSAWHPVSRARAQDIGAGLHFARAARETVAVSCRIKFAPYPTPELDFRSLCRHGSPPSHSVGGVGEVKFAAMLPAIALWVLACAAAALCTSAARSPVFVVPGDTRSRLRPVCQARERVLLHTCRHASCRSRSQHIAYDAAAQGLQARRWRRAWIPSSPHERCWQPARSWSGSAGCRCGMAARPLWSARPACSGSTWTPRAAGAHSRSCAGCLGCLHAKPGCVLGAGRPEEEQLRTRLRSLHSSLTCRPGTRAPCCPAWPLYRQQVLRLWCQHCGLAEPHRRRGGAGLVAGKSAGACHSAQVRQHDWL